MLVSVRVVVLDALLSVRCGAIARLRSCIAVAVLGCAAATPSASAVAERATPFPSGRDWATELFRAGVAQDLAGANQLAALQQFITTLSDSQLTTVRDLLLAAKTPVERFFILKALVAGEPWDRVVEFAIAMRGLSADAIVSRSTARGQQLVPQRWQYSCGPAVTQVALAELNPLAAWRLNEAARGHDAVSTGAAQQRQWLEEYGGVATPVGDVSGRGIPIVALLNDKLSRISGAAYVCRRIRDLDDALSEIARMLQSGYDVPLSVSWVATESSGSADNHFVLALSARAVGYDTEFQIYEPSTGKTEWISASTLRRNSLQPILDRFVRLTHYYEPSPSGSSQRFILASAAEAQARTH